MSEAKFGGPRFKDDCVVQKLATRRQVTRGTDFCRQGIERLVTRHRKCLGCVDDYLVQWRDSGTIKYEALA